MNFSCDQCGRKYSIADERVGDGVKIRCKHCQHVILVQPPPEFPAEESTRMVSLEELERGGVAGPQPVVPPGMRPVAAGARPVPRGASGAKGQRTVAPAPLLDGPDVASAGASSPWEGEATRAVVAPDPNAQWFAMVKGKQVGPFDMRGLSGKVRSGEIGLKTFVWREGMGDWKRAEELPELALLFAGGTAKEEPRQTPVKMDAVRSIAAALQKSAAGMRGPARAVEPSGTAPPAPNASNGVDLPDPGEFDLALDALGDGDHGTVDLDLDLDAPLPASQAEEPLAPSPAPAPAMSSHAAVTVTPGPTRRNPRKHAPPKADPPPSSEPPELGPEEKTPAPDADDASGLAAQGEPASSGTAPDLGSDLFSDLDLRRSGEHPRPIDPGDLTKTADEPAPSGFRNSAGARAAGIPSPMLAKPGGATGNAIAQAGMNRRNPVWKVALLLALLIGLPLAVLYVLATANVVPLKITHVDQSTGETVTDPVFSKGGVTGLRDLLAGKRSTRPPKDAPPKDPSGARSGDQRLSDLYQDGQKKDVGPAAPRGDPAGDEPRDEPVGGPPHEEINKVVEATQRAFQFCIEQELKQNPGFKGGKVKLVATLGPSGAVKKATVDRADIDGSDLGECLKGKARRMVFSPFSGGDVDLEIPLILSTTM